MLNKRLARYCLNIQSNEIPNLFLFDNFHIWQILFNFKLVLFAYVGWGMMTIEEIIKKYLGEKTLEKIEQRLQDRYELSLDQCLFELERFDDVIQ